MKKGWGFDCTPQTPSESATGVPTTWFLGEIRNYSPDIPFYLELCPMFKSSQTFKNKEISLSASNSSLLQPVCTFSPDIWLINT